MSTAARNRRRAIGRWKFAPELNAEQAQSAALLSKALQISQVCARILARRGFGDPAAADIFLTRRMDAMHDPMRLPDMDKAVQRIATAVEKDQRILLFGDYDVDGITATALMARFLKLLKQQTRRKFEVEARVPQRHHGYGLSPEAVKGILDYKPDLLITLDNGISAHDALDTLAAAGTDCIVVDHHHLNAEIPRAIAVVNPKRHDSSYAFDELCGAGISFKLAWALSVHFSQNKRVSPEFRGFLLDAIALAGMGTISDVVPLVDENRILAHHGLQSLGRTRTPGLRALMEMSRVEGTPRTSDVGFRIGPRINAAGRCGDSAEALELLLTDDPERARELALKLDGYNAERQGLENRILEDARKQAQDALSQRDCRALVLHSSEWHHGVIGIVASRIVEEFYRPAVLLSVDPETRIARGSGRSIRGLHLSEALATGKQHLLTFGGHAAAAGLSINEAAIAEFRTVFESTAAGVLKDEDLLPQLHIDECIDLNQATAKLCRELEMLEPCGAANPRPTLAICNALISAPPTLFGKTDNHLSFFTNKNRESRRVVAFNGATHLNALCELRDIPIDIAFRPEVNEFRGQVNVELHLEAFRRSDI